MHDIYTKQNSPEFLERFRAQGRTYDKAKNYSQYIILISIVVVLVLSVLGIIFPKDPTIESISVFYGIVSTVVCFILDRIRSNRKNLAARIQQLIDSELFDIPWERHWGEKPTLDEIQQAAKGEPQNRFVNWYEHAITRVCKEAAVVICFRCNFNYDERLRSAFMQILNWSFWPFVVFMIGVCYFADYGFRNIMTNGVALSLPLIMYYVTTMIQLCEDKDNLEKLRTDVITMQDNLIADRYVAKKDYSSIQTMILKNRESCLDIPSFIYNKYRTVNEEDMATFANRLADEFLTNPKLANE